MQRGTLLAGLLVITFLLAGAIGAAYSGTMMAHDMGGIAGCPLMSNSAVICNMSPLEHLAQWQNAFTTTIPGTSMASLVLLLLVSLLVTRIGRQHFVRDRDSSVQRFRVRYRERLFFANPLQEAFSSGILNPKVF